MPGVVKLAVTVKAGRLELDKKLVRRSLVAAGREVARATKRLISQSSGGGRLYRGPGGSAAKYRGGYTPGAYRASAPGQSPARVTGTLARDVTVKPFRSGEGVAIRDTAFYALFLEAGAHGGGSRGGRGIRNLRRRGKRIAMTARVLEPRPFLSRVLGQREASIGKRIGEAINSGVKFRRVRV